MANPRGAGGRFIADFDFIFDDQQLKTTIGELPSKVDGYIHTTMEYQATKLRKDMKAGAKWTDRTGNARSGLDTQVGWVPMSEHTIKLFHKVSYGIFLETRFAGRFAIIIPTLVAGGADTMRILSKLFSKLKTQGVIP